MKNEFPSCGPKEKLFPDGPLPGVQVNISSALSSPSTAARANARKSLKKNTSMTNMILN